jgi:hypothetical protein
MDKAGRRAARAAYKEQKPEAGVFAVRCSATGQTWVGATPTLDTIKTRLWFVFKQRASAQPDMQSAWNEHGESAFSFEVLEQFDEERANLMQRDWLKDRAAHWRTQLGAAALI